MTIAVLSSKGFPGEKLFSQFNYNDTVRQIDKIIDLVKGSIQSANQDILLADMDKRLPDKMAVDEMKKVDLISEPLEAADAVIFVISYFTDLLGEIDQKSLYLSMANYREKLKKQKYERSKADIKPLKEERKAGILIGCASSNAGYTSHAGYRRAGCGGMDEFEKIARECGIYIADRLLVTELNESYMMGAVSSACSLLLSNYDNFNDNTWGGVKDFKRFIDWSNSSACCTERERRLQKIIDSQERQIQADRNLIQSNENLLQSYKDVRRTAEEAVRSAKECNDKVRELLNNQQVQSEENLKIVVPLYEAGTAAISDENYEGAADILRKALEPVLSGDQFNWGVVYHNGIGVEVDYLKALFWFEKAAAQDHADANRVIGCFYIEGTGVEKDYEAALHYLRRAEELGNANALTWLGLCYLNGWGVENDDQEAFSYFNRAADKSDAQGIRLMGYCYESGRGVEENLDKALELYRKAYERGDAQAKEALEELQEEMSETEESTEDE